MAVGCCMSLCFRRSGALWVLRAVAGRLGPCSCASVLCCWSALVGRLSVLECAFWGFPLSLALLHLFPPLRLFVTLSVTRTPLFLLLSFVIGSGLGVF